MRLRNLNASVCFLVLVFAFVLAVSNLLYLVGRLWQLCLDAQR